MEKCTLDNVINGDVSQFYYLTNDPNNESSTYEHLVPGRPSTVCIVFPEVVPCVPDSYFTDTREYYRLNKNEYGAERLISILKHYDLVFTNVLKGVFLLESCGSPSKNITINSKQTLCKYEVEFSVPSLGVAKRHYYAILAEGPSSLSANELRVLLEVTLHKLVQIDSIKRFELKVVETEVT